MEWMILPLKRYADFRGRSRRKEYWMFFLFSILIGIGFAILTAVAGGSAAAMGGDSAALAAGGAVGIIAILQLVVNLALLVPSIAVGVRRLHDIDRSGWWLLLPMVGYVIIIIGLIGSGVQTLSAGTGSVNSAASAISGMFVVIMIGGLITLGLAILLLVWFCTEGTRGPNRFGPDPKNPDGDLESVFS